MPRWVPPSDRSRAIERSVDHVNPGKGGSGTHDDTTIDHGVQRFPERRAARVAPSRLSLFREPIGIVRLYGSAPMPFRTRNEQPKTPEPKTRNPKRSVRPVRSRVQERELAWVVDRTTVEFAGMSASRLPLIRVTRRTAAAGREALARHGIVASFAAHTLVGAMAIVRGWFGIGVQPDPVLPYPPRHDRASIAVAMAPSARETESAPVRIESPRSAMESATIAPPEASETGLTRSATAERSAPIVVQPLDRQSAVDRVLMEGRTVARSEEPIERIPRRADRVAEDVADVPVNPFSSAGAMSRASAGVETTVPPRVLVNPAPSYPREALVAGRTGTVLLRVEIAADGHVMRIAVHESSGDPTLDAAALDAVRRWAFLPARDPAALPRPVLVPIEFVIRRR